MDIASFFNHDIVAALNVIHHPSSPFNAATCLSPLARGSLCIRVTYQIYGYVEPAVKEGYFELFSCSLQPGFQASYDGLVYVLYGLLQSLSFGKAARKVKAFSHVSAIIIFLNGNLKFHLYLSLSCIMIRLSRLLLATSICEIRWIIGKRLFCASFVRAIVPSVGES